METKGCPSPVGSVTLWDMVLVERELTESLRNDGNVKRFSTFRSTSNGSEYGTLVVPGHRGLEIMNGGSDSHIGVT